MEEKQEPIMIDMDEMADYIQERLMAKGFAVPKEAIFEVLQAEEAFLAEKGVIEYDPEGE